MRAGGRTRGTRGLSRPQAVEEEEEDEELEIDEDEEDDEEDVMDDEDDDDDDDEEERRRRRSSRRRRARQVQYTYSSGGGSDSEDNSSSGGGERRRSSKSAGKKGTGKSRRELPPGAVQTLKQWLLSAEHFNHPYPTPQDQQQLMAATGIDKKQLKNWFTNARRRIWKPMMRKQQQAELGTKGGSSSKGGGADHHHHHSSGSRHRPSSSPKQQSTRTQGGHHSSTGGGAHPTNGGTGGLHPVGSLGSMLALSGFASVDDFFKSLFSDPSPSPTNQGQQGGGQGGQQGATQGPQPGIHPLMNALKSSRSLSNLRATASVADFPRTDSYAFLEVFFNDEGLEGLEPLESIGLNLDGDNTAQAGTGTARSSSAEGSPTSADASAHHHQQHGGLKRQVLETADGAPSSKRQAAHVAFLGMQQQQAGEGLMPPPLPLQIPTLSLAGNRSGTPRAGSPHLFSLMQLQQQAVAASEGAARSPSNGSLNGSLHTLFSPTHQQLQAIKQQQLDLGQQQSLVKQDPEASSQQQGGFRGGSSMVTGSGHTAGARGSPPAAVHVSTAARCPFCPELNVDTQLRPCGHLFHGNCLKPWLEEAQGPPGCPVCNLTITSCVLAIPCINTVPGVLAHGGHIRRLSQTSDSSDMSGQLCHVADQADADLSAVAAAAAAAAVSSGGGAYSHMVGPLGSQSA